MQDDAAPEQKGCHDDRQADVAAFGKDHLRPEADDDEKRLQKAQQDKKRVHEILPGKITAQFPGKNSFVGNVRIFKQVCIELVS